MLESALTAEEERRLLQLARQSIVAAVEGQEPPGLPPEELTEGLVQPLGAFVTLYEREELRGCIGRMQYDRPLHLNVVDAAVASALNDPRFSPVTAQEVPQLRIEVSVLNEPQPIESVEQFDTDQHGIVMDVGFTHGVFLPKVAREYGWDRPTTLMMLCRKIGLPDDRWMQSDARFRIFHAHEFGEKV